MRKPYKFFLMECPEDAIQLVIEEPITEATITTEYNEMLASFLVEQETQITYADPQPDLPGGVKLLQVYNPDDGLVFDAFILPNEQAADAALVQSIIEAIEAL